MSQNFTTPPPLKSPTPPTDPQGELAAQFSNTKKIKGTPILGTLNGFGLSMYGRSKYDADTQTYLKNHALTLLFIPVFTLATYRVSDAENGGWYFIGKESVGKFAKGWNVVLTVVIAGAISMSLYTSHINSPNYLANKAIVAATAKLENGDIKAAISGYQRACAIKSPKHRSSALEGFKNGVKKAFEIDDPEVILFATKSLMNASFWPQIRSDYPNLYQDTCEVASRYAERSPDSSLQLIDFAQRIAGTDTSWIEAKFAILEKITATQKPLKIEYAEQLAAMYEELGDSEKIVALLAPLQDRISGRVSAKILGAAYLSTDAPGKAIPHLLSYLKGRQQPWLDAQQNIVKVYEAAETKIIRLIKDGRAPENIYNLADKIKGEKKQQEFWNDYLSKQVEKDANYRRLSNILEDGSDIPASILDLGVAYLHLAQVDPTKSTELLQKAESTLLSMHSYAGESTEYQLFLGQVYYWLGKSAEGKKQFDAILVKHSEDYNVLSNLAEKLRNIGVVDESIKLIEKAYEVAKTDEEKHSAASFRAIVTLDSKEKITWLEKCNPNDPYTIINLSSAKANVAILENKTAIAIKLYKESIAAYNKLPVSAANLNNSALVHFSLFQITGELQHNEDGLKKMDQAVRLSPNDSILCYNASSCYFAATAQDLLKDKVEARILQNGLSVSTSFRYHYNNETERKAIFDQVKEHPHYKKACQLFNKALLLAPQRLDLYQQGHGTFTVVQDTEQLQSLVDKFQASQPDLSELKGEWLEALSSLDIAEREVSVKNAMIAYNEILSETITPFGKALIQANILILDTGYWQSDKDLDLTSRIATMKKFMLQHPSSAMHSTLNDLLYIKACQEMCKNYKEFEKWITFTNNQLGNSALLLLWLDSKGSSKEVLSKCPSVKEALESDWALNQRFASSYNIDDWVLAKVIAPEKAASVAKTFENHKCTKLSNELSKKLTGYHPSNKLRTAWRMMSKGDDKAGRSYYKEAVKITGYMPAAY